MCMFACLQMQMGKTANDVQEHKIRKPENVWTTLNNAELVMQECKAYDL